MINTCDTRKTIKSNLIQEWCVDKFETVFGEFPEIEETKISETPFQKKSLLKKHKSIRYLLLPLVIVLIIIDESYLRIRNCVKNIDKSE